MRHAVILAAAMLATFASARADDDVMAGFYGNTAVSSGGRYETHTVFYADHSFDLAIPAFSLHFKGTWKVTGDTLCRTYESPPPDVPNPFCTPIAAHKVGDSWTISASGQTRTITLMPGVQ
jgi:hypothetical protein